MTDQARVYVTTCSLEISLKTQTESDSDQAGHIEETELGEELRDRYTGPPRGNTKELVYHVPKNLADNG